MERNIYIFDIGLVIEFPLYNISNLFTIKGIEYNEPILYTKVISIIVIYIILSTFGWDINKVILTIQFIRIKRLFLPFNLLIIRRH